MNRLAIVILFLLSFVPVSFADETKSINKGQFTAPGTTKADMKAPERPDLDARKSDPADWKGSAPPGTPGYPSPVVPANGMCPDHYDCVSANNGASLRCRHEGGSVQAISDCAKVTHYCANLQRSVDEQKLPTPPGQTGSFEEREYARMCV